jgi:hypothetical protein
MNVPSSKNSKQLVHVKRKDDPSKTRPLFIDSKTVQKYKKNTEMFYASRGTEFKRLVEGLPKPYHVTFKFIRDSKRKFDYINPAQTVQDLMVKYGWIDDDNCDEIVPYFLPYETDKLRAGVEIGVIATPLTEYFKNL